ncbi:MAG: nitrogenase component 1 [Desulfuromonadales bacterium]
MSETIGKHIAIYGKGGIGKSTTTSNISASLAAAGYRVIQIGCDPKSDSTTILLGGNDLPTVLDTLREQSKVRLEDISAVGFGGVLCIEAGGPVPGVGCAGRGINAAVDLLQELHLFEEYKPDFVLYDVLGDSRRGLVVGVTGYSRPNPVLLPTTGVSDMAGRQSLVIREKRLGAIGAYLGEIPPLIESFEQNSIAQRIRTFSQTAPDDIVEALRVMNRINGAGLIIHGARGCAAVQLSLSPGGAWATTNLDERDTIMGSDAVLRKAIIALYSRHHPRVIFVVATPVVAINNDDIRSVATELSDELDIPVIPVICDGFRSRIAATGYDAAKQAILKSGPLVDGEQRQEIEQTASPVSTVLNGKRVYLGLPISAAVTVVSLVHSAGGTIAGISVDHIDAGHLDDLKALQQLQPGIVLHVAGGQPFEEAGLLHRIKPELYLGTPERAVWAARAGIPAVAATTEEILKCGGLQHLLRQTHKALANPAFVRRLARDVTPPYTDAWYRRSPDWHIKLEVK